MVYYKAVLAGITLLVCFAVSADTGTPGQELHKSNCVSCHDDSVYQRQNRSVKSMADLKAQIQRCELTIDLGWSPEEVDSIAGYLNTKYYHFK